MNQVMLSPYECANPNCTNKTIIEGNQHTGGLSHIKHNRTWYTGYICKQCANISTTTMSGTAVRNQRLALQISIAQRQQTTNQEWKKPPKKKEAKPLTPDELQRRNATRQKNKQKTEFGWLHQWLDKPKLKNLFPNHKSLQAFATTYGYRLTDTKQIIEHKQTQNEEMI